MSTRLQKQIGVDAAWFLGVLLLGAVAVGGTMKKLHGQRNAVDAQRNELSTKKTRLTDEVSARVRLLDLAAAKERLLEADSMLVDEAGRISLISKIAEGSSMRVVSLRSGTPRPTANSAVLAKSHELIAVGEYRDLAVFIDALQRAEGSVAIDAIKVGPLQAATTPTRRRGTRGAPEVLTVTGSEDRRLRISLEVIWLGVSQDFDTLQEAKKS